MKIYENYMKIFFEAISKTYNHDIFCTDSSFT